MKRQNVPRLLAVLLILQVLVFGNCIYSYASGQEQGDPGLTEEDLAKQAGEDKEMQMYDLGIPGALVGADGEFYYTVTWDKADPDTGESAGIVTPPGNKRVKTCQAALALCSRSGHRGREAGSPARGEPEETQAEEAEGGQDMGTVLSSLAQGLRTPKTVPDVPLGTAKEVPNVPLGTAAATESAGTAKGAERETGTAMTVGQGAILLSGASLRSDSSRGVPEETQAGVAEGECPLVAHGNAKGDYEVVIRIVKPGVIGEAQAAISTDGGTSWVAKFTVEDQVKIQGLGLKLEFSTAKDTDEFAEGDIFRFTTVESFAFISDHPEAAQIALTGHPLEKARPGILILSSGPRGVSKFALRMQEGTEPVVVDTVPEDGTFAYDKLKFYFSDSTYIKGYTFTGTIVPNEEKVGPGPVIVSGGIILGLIVVAFVLMAQKRERPGDYELRPWAERQGEEAYK